MKLAQVIALYVAFRKNLGVSFENDAKLLQMFSRVVGETLDISSVPANRVKAFLDGRGGITCYWHRKFTVLRGFYRYAISRGYVAVAPLPTMAPKQPERFVPHIYSREELQRLLDGMLAGDYAEKAVIQAGCFTLEQSFKVNDAPEIHIYRRRGGVNGSA